MSVQFHQRVLSNGLTIIAECDPAAHSAAAGYFVKTGARDEDAKVMGVSHFLEHMMFKGTPSRSAEAINQAFDQIGARNNAYTSSEMTCFHATVLPETLLGKNGANEILADMMRPALRQEDFDTEKNVILEEIAMYEDNPFWVLYERALEEHYAGDTAGKPHPLGHRVLGTKQTIADLTSEQMRSYFEMRYSADNTIVALAGAVDFNAAADEIERLCGSWKSMGVKHHRTTPPLQDRQIQLQSEKVNRAYGIMLWSGPGMSDPRRYAATLMTQVLGGQDNSRLHWSLIETGLAEQAEAALEAKDGCGDMMVYVACDPQKRDEIWAIVQRELTKLSDSLVDEDLDKIRCKAATGVTLAGERPSGRMQRLGRQWTYLGRYSTLEEELQQLQNVTVQDVRSVIRDFSFTPSTTGWLLPMG